MFEWAQGTALRAMMKANVPGAVHDDWLTGWMHAFVQCRLDLKCPLEMLDITWGDGPRPYLETFTERGVNISTADVNLVANQANVDAHEREYDLVMLLSHEHEQCLKPIDFNNPVQIVDMLLNAAHLLKPGGALIWSYLHCFSSSPEHVHSLLEPAAVYQTLVRRKFKHLSENKFGIGRVAMLNSSDTLFVRQKPILELSDRYERVTRILAGVYRAGAGCRVTYLPADIPLTFSSDRPSTDSGEPAVAPSATAEGNSTKSTSTTQPATT